MNAVMIESIVSSWKALQAVSPLGHIVDEKHYDEVIALMDVLVDEGAMRPDHQWHELFATAADLVGAYETKHYPLPPVSGLQMLKFLMDQHDLKQSDLREEIGSQGVVSEILSGKRELNKTHIAALAKRFSVSPAAFFD